MCKKTETNTDEKSKKNNKQTRNQSWHRVTERTKRKEKELLTKREILKRKAN